jgi:hypothetical protein
MKTKHAIMLLVVGYCFDFIGALLKITHSSSTDTVLTIGAILKVTGGLLFLYKILTYPKFKDVLNW